MVTISQVGNIENDDYYFPMSLKTLSAVCDAACYKFVLSCLNGCVMAVILHGTY